MRLLAFLVLVGFGAAIGYYVYIGNEAAKSAVKTETATADSAAAAATAPAENTVAAAPAAENAAPAAPAAVTENDADAMVPNTLFVKSAETVAAEANVAEADAAVAAEKKKSASRIPSTLKTRNSKNVGGSSLGSNRSPTSGGGLRNWAPVKRTDDAFKNHNNQLENAAQQ